MNHFKYNILHYFPWAIYILKTGIVKTRDFPIVMSYLPISYMYVPNKSRLSFL